MTQGCRVQGVLHLGALALLEVLFVRFRFWVQGFFRLGFRDFGTGFGLGAHILGLKTWPSGLISLG